MHKVYRKYKGAGIEARRIGVEFISFSFQRSANSRQEQERRFAGADVDDKYIERDRL